MAEQRPSGFKTFLLLLITLILAFFLGCGAFLMISPDLEIFGVSYVSNREKVTLLQVPNSVGTETDLHFYNYDKIVVDATNATVNVLCGTQNASVSQISLEESSMGFLKTGSEKDYNLNCQTVGQVLFITLTEPDYSFLTLTNNTTLNLKINANEGLIGVEFDITTTNGNVNFGGSTAPTYEAEEFTTPGLTVETTGGNVTLDESVSVESLGYPQGTYLNLTTTTGYIKLKKDINAKAVNLTTQSGRITTQDFVLANVSLAVESYSSIINIGDISGNVSLNTANGIFQAGVIYGTFTTGEDLNYANITIDEIVGDVSISKENGNFSVNIGKTRGEVSILGGTKSVVLSDICGGASVNLTSGSIQANINATCNEIINFSTTTGSVVAKFATVKGSDNLISTERGKIDVKFVYGTSFYLNAETSAKITKVWENLSDENPIVDKVIGENPLSSNILTLYSAYGYIVIDGTSA